MSGASRGAEAARLGVPGRLAWAAAALAALLALCVFRARTHPDTTLRDVLADPAAHAGKTIDLASETVVASVGAEAFVAAELGREILVRARLDPEDVGRYVHARGVFHPAGADGAAWLEPEVVRVLRGRRWKIWISLAPLVWVALLFAASFRVVPSRLALELRQRA
jgi:hypothetical protein